MLQIHYILWCNETEKRRFFDGVYLTAAVADILTIWSVL